MDAEKIIEGGRSSLAPVQSAVPKRSSWRSGQLLKYLGPAFIVSVAYIDPGNFGTNISGGSLFGYKLVWVILASNLMAIFVQILSAKLGIVTGKNLPTLCGEVFSRPVNWGLWVVGEFAAIATDMAEFIGGTLGFYLLLRIPILWAAVLTGVVTMGLVYLQRFGHRAIETAIVVFVAVIGISYLLEVFLAQPDWAEVAFHCFVPSLTKNSVLYAVGMLGATVMPHVIFLHSQLVQARRTSDHEDIKKHLRLEKLDVGIAMNIAFFINAAMVVVSAAVFNSRGLQVITIEQAHQTLAPLLGSFSSLAFGMALLASGLSSSAVGTMAGEVILDGFVNFHVPSWAARLITIAPAEAVLVLGFDPMQVLVLSQVTLSFALPGAVIPLLLLTNKRSIMGGMANTPLVKAIGWLVAGAILALNAVLLYLTFF
jgi:manganese transport protein